MLKRGANGSFGVAEGSRSKRPRRDADEIYTSDDEDAAMSDNQQSDGEESGAQNVAQMAMEPEEVKRHGLHIWQTVKDAVNKDGRIMSPIFMRKPLKRMYPDYYILIKQPIALDDIRARIDKGVYPTLEDVRQDFELCFNNAKQYNQKESEIWKDAKDLLKIVHKAYSKIVPQEGEEKKSKPPSLNRLLKTRLQKLVDKTDENGRYLSTEFMELPSRKQWPIYYKQIKQPQCLGNILKKIKRKEYHGAADFAADVELVFSNAMIFNQEHTQIWEDALALRTIFRQLISDLPAPHSLSQYSQHSTKIKIKPQAVKAEASQPSLTLRVPATAPTHKAIPVAPLPVAPNKVVHPPQPVAATPAPVTATRSSPRPHPVPLQPQPIAAPSPLVQSATPQPLASSGIIAGQGVATPVPVPAAASSSILRTSSVQNSAPAAVSTPSPAPPSSQHQLKSVRVQVEPRGRVVYLHHTDGVKGWALRLLPGETRIVISDVVFQPSHEDEDEDSSDEEDEDEDDYDEDMAVDTTPTRNGRKKGKGRRKGRPTRSSARHANITKPLKKKSSKPGEVQLKVNGVVVAAQADQPGEWDVHLPLGPNVLDIGESGGLIWKVYAERVGTI